jgi:catechol 2,3-dioxygenase-like lactoylglutathione lyase family enzyme
MIAHISIGVRDVERSKRFYDAVLEPLGYSVSEPREG